MRLRSDTGLIPDASPGVSRMRESRSIGRLSGSWLDASDARWLAVAVVVAAAKPAAKSPWSASARQFTPAIAFGFRLVAVRTGLGATLGEAAQVPPGSTAVPTTTPLDDETHNPGYREEDSGNQPGARIQVVAALGAYRVAVLARAVPLKIRHVQQQQSDAGHAAPRGLHPALVSAEQPRDQARRGQRQGERHDAERRSDADDNPTPEPQPVDCRPSPHCHIVAGEAYTDIRQGELVDTYARSAMGSTIRATKPAGDTLRCG